MTGGFARGEGAVLKGRPQNDYDFVAFRRPGPAGKRYARLRRELEARIGLHIDLSPVSTWRVPWLSRSIFWYETALRGRVLWGEDVLSRIPVRSPDRIDQAEGLRLLTNRAAGLLLATRDPDEHALRLQAAKAILAAVDAHLLSLGDFAPSQRERWHLYLSRWTRDALPQGAPGLHWAEWAYTFKTRPAEAEARAGSEAWHAAARILLAAVPEAIAHARLPSLDAYARRDGLIDHLVYARRSAAAPGARRFALHPTARVRVETLRLLEAMSGAQAPPPAATFGGLLRRPQEPIASLDALRRATLQ